MKRPSPAGIKRTEDRWALAYWCAAYGKDAAGRWWGRWYVLGFGCWCWPNGGPHKPALTDPDTSPRIQTFRTRELARQAQRDCCYRPTRIVRVRVTTELLP